MKIGIDARFVGPQGTGLGKYTEKLIINLANIDSENKYSIFLRKDNWNYLDLKKFNNFEKVPADIPWYTLEEQLKLPKIFEKSNLDLLHVPHFNAPIFYKGKMVMTIHDLIHHSFKEQTATTRNPFIFHIKRLGYKAVIFLAVRKSAKIMVPSNFVKKEVTGTFKLSSSKVVVTYEAAEEEYFKNIQLSESTYQRLLEKYQIKNPFIIYVGNAYPHKNLARLLDAVYLLKNINLLVACPRDVFAGRLLNDVKQRQLGNRVVILPFMPPKILSQLFRKAKAYVFPSLSEGFGIPGLNAMAAGIPVIASSIPTLEEVYGEAALYFDPQNPYDIADKIKQVFAYPKLRSKLITAGADQVKKYSWRKMAQETMKVYQEVTSKGF